jgi:peptidoglycan/LPS O-acetylase OafA/YrhL
LIPARRMLKAKPAVLRQDIATNTSIWLDVIRGIAAQIVLFSHAFQIFFAGGSSATPGYIAAMTVALSAKQAVVAFFVVSGWLVGGKLLGEIVAQKFDLQKYIIDRTTRLWVVLIPALVLTMMCDHVATHFGSGASIIASRSPFYPEWWYQTFPWSVKTFLSNLFFLQMMASWQFGTNLSLWSISNEFWYYLLFPCILGIFFACCANTKLACLACVAVILSLFLVSNLTSLYISYFLIWGISAMVAYLQKRRATFIIGAFALASPTIVTITTGVEIPSALQSNLYTATVTLLVLALGHKISMVKLYRPAKFFSGYSYSLYAIHLPTILFLMSFDPILIGRVEFSTGSFTRFVVYVTIVNIFAYGFSCLTERYTNEIRGVVKSACANLRVHISLEKGGSLRTMLNV